MHLIQKAALGGLICASLTSPAVAIAVPASATAAIPAAISFAAAPPAGGTLVLILGDAAALDAQRLLDPATRGAVRHALDDAAFDYAEGGSLSLRGISGRSEILVLGAGKTQLSALTVQKLGGLAGQQTRRAKGSVSILTDGLPEAANPAENLALGATLGRYGFGLYRQGGTGALPPLTIITPAPDRADTAFRDRPQALTDAVAFTRDLISEPANVIYPESFVSRARAAFDGVSGTRIEVLDVAAMEKLGMGAILAVGQGSARPPRLFAVEYKGPGIAADSRPIALVGKGITFDSGGISIKAAAGMWRMKMDMSGAAAVTGAVLALARAKAPVHVVAIAALAENMPDGRAARPGDIVRSLSGKTIEIINTDAEGRLVLADAVAYAERRYRPAAIVDVATLTGSMVTALGAQYAGLFSRHDKLADALLASGQATDEALWRMPLHPAYADIMKSDIADISNAAEGANPGAGLGAHFIGAFLLPETPWVHLDIAGRAWAREDQPLTPKGAAGFGVRLLDQFVRTYRPE